MKEIVIVSAIFVALLATSAIGLPSYPSVVKFSIYEKEEILIKRPVQLKKYKFANCQPKAKEIFFLKDLELMPDPLSFPGPLRISFDGEVKSTVDAPLKADVYLGKKVGSEWIKIPCIGNIGSCSYEDLCDLLAGVTCPDPFVTAGIPCKCPFKSGSYNLPKFEVDVESAVFPPGDYYAQANLTSNGKVVGCYEIDATFA